MINKYKKISKSEYNIRLKKIKKKLGDWYVLDDSIYKSLKKEFIDSNTQKGCGILKYIETQKHLSDIATEDDYDYFEKDGYDYVLYGGEGMIKEYKRILENI